MRSHDERLDARINALPYDKSKASPVVTVVDAGVPADPQTPPETPAGEGDGGFVPTQSDLFDEMGGASKQLQEAINALIVKKCGTKVYWDVWAKDIAGIALRHIQRISEIICTDETAQVEFGKFLQFESLTLCPIDKSPIVKEMLLQEEIDWLNAYHKDVYDRLSKRVDGELLAYLEEVTKPIQK